jgi:CRP-like cAMP-binding protein
LQHSARAILRQQPLFGCLSDAQLDALLPRGQVAHFGRGETLIRQGDNGDSMFILVNGEAGVMVEAGGELQPVASLHSGDCFGEMSLLTGEPRRATVRALADCDVVEIRKAVLARSLKENPELLAQLSGLLARRQLETEGALAALPNASAHDRQTTYEANFLARLRTFFEL